jgi:hypothetical protein
MQVSGTAQRGLMKVLATLRVVSRILLRFASEEFCTWSRMASAAIGSLHCYAPADAGR